MGYVPGFDEDLFISYSHKDNQSLEGPGWIDCFHNALRIRLMQLTGHELNIWRDPKLGGNDYFDDVISAKIARVATMVSVLTPSYRNSGYCQYELKEFLKDAQTQGGVRLDHKSRVFKVVKTPIPREAHPSELRDLLGYEFYRVDPTRERPDEFLPEKGSELYRDYLARLEDLAYDIHELLTLMREGATASSGITVYLAETTSDLDATRDIIKRELRSRGHTVLPDQSLPLHVDEFSRAVQENLERSSLSVHLMGEHYGIIPEGADRSIVDLQNEIAAQIGPSLRKVLWMPRGIQAEEPRQKDFITHIRQVSGGQANVEMLETTLEELKTYLQDCLTVKKAAPAAQPAAAPALQRIYLICDAQDQDNVRPLEDYLFNKGYEVVRPLMEGNVEEVQDDHRENLLSCDAVIVYWGAAGEPWLRTKLRDVQKAGGYGRGKPYSATAVYLDAPSTDAKERFRTHDAMTIRGVEKFSEAAMQPFIQQLTVKP